MLRSSLFNLTRTKAKALVTTFAALLLVGCGTIHAPAPSMPATPAPPALVFEAAPPVIEPAGRPRSVEARPLQLRQRQALAATTSPPDAIPRIERIASGHPNAPYAIKGIGYEPVNEDLPMKEIGVASWYGADFHGRPASTGERFDMRGMSAAHPTMPLPSYAIVRNLDNGRQVIVRVNDRGPFISNRIIDLSFAAAQKLGISGLGRVEVERITHSEIRTGSWKLQAPDAMSFANAGSTARPKVGSLALGQ